MSRLTSKQVKQIQDNYLNLMNIFEDKTRLYYDPTDTRIPGGTNIISFFSTEGEPFYISSYEWREYNDNKDYYESKLYEVLK